MEFLITVCFTNKNHNTKMSFRFVLTVFLLFSFHVKAFSTDNDSIAYHVFKLIYNQKFTEAEKILDAEHNHLDKFYFNILKLDLYWWRYSLSKSKKDAGDFNKILSEFDTPISDNQSNRINKLVSSSYQMRYEVKRYNLIGALLLRTDVRKQIKVLQSETLQLSASQLKLFNFYIALFQYFDYSINPFPLGSKSPELLNSLSQMETYANDSDLILSTLAHYFLGRIDLKVRNKTEEGREHFRILASRFPANTMFPSIANGTNTKF